MLRDNLRFFFEVILVKKMTESVIEFCKARQSLRDEEIRSKDVMDETSDAKRVSMDLLTDSMKKNMIDCIVLPPNSDGIQKYARLVCAPTRYATFRSWEDISRFATGFQRHISQLPEDEVPAEVIRLFLERATIKGTKQKLVILPKIPNKVNPSLNPPSEVSRLGKTLNNAILEYKSCREPIRTLKTIRNEAEKKRR